MNTATRIPLRLAPGLRSRLAATRPIHYTAGKAANVAPVVGTGPPPEPPSVAVANAYERVERRRKQAKLLKEAKELRSANANGLKKGGLKTRFWKDVDVKEVDGTFLSKPFPCFCEEAEDWLGRD